VIARVLYTEVEGGNRDQAVANLNENVIPELKKQPGFVAAYWMADESGKGLTTILWSDATTEAANEARVGPQREEMMAKYGVRLTKKETREVVAHSH
jgi:hypothetical protein